MREIEIKLKVHDLKSLEERLVKDGVQLSQAIRQRDVIYSQKGSEAEFESAKEGDIILRIRNNGGKWELNLKQQRSGEMDNLEYETEFKDARSMDLILKSLGWKPVIEVLKDRRKGKYKDYEICLDSVEGLGEYVELEKLTDDNSDPTLVREELFKTLESLGLNREDEETRGYDTQLYLLKK